MNIIENKIDSCYSCEHYRCNYISKYGSYCNLLKNKEDLMINGIYLNLSDNLKRFVSRGHFICKNFEKAKRRN
jgi:hypothetical protein